MDLSKIIKNMTPKKKPLITGIKRELPVAFPASRAGRIKLKIEAASMMPALKPMLNWV